jgi:hypothetical protein
VLERGQGQGPARVLVQEPELAPEREQGLGRAQAQVPGRELA